MSINPESALFNAILSMDSYSRDYSQAISGLAGEFGSPLGSYTILMDSRVLVDSSDQRRDIPAGFYAIAYQYVDANNKTQTIISYRGTDDMIVEWDDTLQEWQTSLDVNNGYSERTI